MAEIAPGLWSRPLDAARDAPAVLELCNRAEDYIRLETRRAPDAAYVRDFFEERPAGFGLDQVRPLGLGAAAPGAPLRGIMTHLIGYDDPESWYVGLILLEPGLRGQGAGAAWLRHLGAKARAKGMRWIKLAVLCANPGALRFYARLGFAHHRDAPAQPGGDGHDRVVLKWNLESKNAA